MVSKKKNPVILFRKSHNLQDIDTENEFQIVKQKFLCTVSRNDFLCKDALVIGRYSVLPFYLELETDLAMVGSRLINTYEQHNYLADLQQWYEDLKDFTPKTWFHMEDVPEGECPYILKGETNSKKFLWDTHMYAPTKKDAVQVMLRLMDDGLIGSQRIYIRKYVPLFRLATGYHGLPITKEFRFFIYKNIILSGGFYWSSHSDDLEDLVGGIPSPSEVPDTFLREVMDRIRGKANFYALDVAQQENGEWIVVELNDGQMSGLSENDPNLLYSNLRDILEEESIFESIKVTMRYDGTL